MSPRQDRVRRRRGSQKRHETAGLGKSHGKKSTFGGGCYSREQLGGGGHSRRFILFLRHFQAQARFNESSQKLDLLRYSLEQRLSELPKNHPRISSIVEELTLLSSPVLSPRSSIISTQNQYSTVTKPAALTGSRARPRIYPRMMKACTNGGVV